MVYYTVLNIVILIGIFVSILGIVRRYAGVTFSVTDQQMADFVLWLYAVTIVILTIMVILKMMYRYKRNIYNSNVSPIYTGNYGFPDQTC